MQINTDVTLRRLVHELAEWSNSHKMISRFFGYGEYLQLSSEIQRLYPAMIVNVTSANADKWYINYNVEVMILQYVNDEQDNRERAMSDCRQILNDLQETVSYSNRWQSFSRLDGAFNAVPAIQKGADKAFGWIGTFTLKVKKRHGICNLQSLMPEYDFETGTIVSPTCAPVSIYRDDVFEENVASGGRFDYSTACADATITVNGDDFETVTSGATLDVEVEYETSVSDPIQSIIGNKIIIVDPVVIPTNRVYIRPIPTGEIYVPDSSLFPVGCDSWMIENSIDISTQPSAGISMLVDKSKRWRLVPDNIFGHKFRHTGLTGGYYDPETGSYYDSFGGTTTFGGAFPNDYMIDHSTGLGWKLTANTGNLNWYGSLTDIAGLSHAGFNDYYMPNSQQLGSVVDLGYGATLGSSGDTNPIFPGGITNGTKWTSTTRKGVETRAWVLTTDGSVSGGFLKTNIMRYMAFRFHFNNS